MVTQSEDDETVGEPSHGLDVDSIFGVHIVRAADPSDHAAQLARNVDGEVVRDIDHAARAFVVRAEAGRAEPVVLKDEEWAELEAAAETSESDAAANEATIAELQQLADELAMTERIRQNTETEFTDSLSRRLSAASAVAIHPDAIRRAATTVTEAEADVVGCEAELAALGPSPSAPRPASWAGVGGGEDAAEADAAEPTEPTEPTERAEPERRGAVLAIVVGLVFAAGAVVLLALGLPRVAIVAFVVGLAAAASLLRRHPAPTQDDSTGTREASELLASATTRDLAGTPPTGPKPQPRPLLSDAEWEARHEQLEQATERANERLRSARRHWDSLVGPDADPHDVDDIVRVRDPQLELVGAASKTSPTVRTVSAVHRRTLARWRVAWAGVGYDDPPDLDDVQSAFEHLRVSGGNTAGDARERLAAAQAWREACATIDRPIVLVEPEAWLPKDQLETMLGTLPAGAEVIIVEPDSPEAD